VTSETEDTILVCRLMKKCQFEKPKTLLLKLRPEKYKNHFVEHKIYRGYIFIKLLYSSVLNIREKTFFRFIDLLIYLDYSIN